ncbi:HTH DNA binding protein [Arthrobacter phage Brent]|uniref:Helix-turn-helix DNA binding domain protein n=1 Tax=Arthrobacter phage Brent TaxID=1701798 RepID=A0A0M4S4B2_9CAUD|nr:HTH DNA binding protein [Arthrobacter phage Brent]ALF01247.1 helix-turn-helix DNA binding domain protein [Arthrobacter phage Brent]
MSTENLPAGEQAPGIPEQLAEAARQSKAARAHLVESVLDAKAHNITNVDIAKQIGVTEAAVRQIIKRAEQQA